MSLNAYFLNQGRVDSILLECDGVYAFIDGGYRRNGVRAVAFMRKLGVSALRYYIATHGHKNHIEAAAVVMGAIPTDVLVIGRTAVKDAILRYAREPCEAEGIGSAMCRAVYKGHSLPLGGAVIRCIGPNKQASTSCGSLSENRNSLILRVEHEGRVKLLLTGDSSSKIIAKCGGAAKADVMKNPHHAGSQPKSLLEQVQPSEVVVSSNVKPLPGYRRRITNVGATLRCTCEGRVELQL